MLNLDFNRLDGWDLHIHPDPDLVLRIQTVQEVLEEGVAANMTGVVVKSNWVSDAFPDRAAKCLQVW